MKWTNYIKGDKYIWAIAILLSLASIVLVYSSSSHLAFAFKQGNTISFLLKHLIHLGIGFGIMWMLSRVPFKYFYNSSIIFFGIAIILICWAISGGQTISEPMQVDGFVLQDLLFSHLNWQSYHCLSCWLVI